MPPKSRGKKFESEIASMLKDHPAVAYAFHAPDLPPSARLKFSLPNPIDFLCYLVGGRGLVIECKAVSGKSLPFSRFTSKRERENGKDFGRQWRALERCALGDVSTYVFVNAHGWPGRDGQRGRAWAVPFHLLRSYRETATRKSWPLALFGDCVELGKVGKSWGWKI